MKQITPAELRQSQDRLRAGGKPITEAELAEMEIEWEGMGDMPRLIAAVRRLKRMQALCMCGANAFLPVDNEQ